MGTSREPQRLCETETDINWANLLSVMLPSKATDKGRYPIAFLGGSAFALFEIQRFSLGPAVDHLRRVVTR